MNENIQITSRQSDGGFTAVIEGVKRQSRLFNDPTPPKPSRESMIAEINEVMEELHETALNLRRLENRLVLVKSKLEGLEIQP